jgi:hypothetical protein
MEPVFWKKSKVAFESFKKIETKNLDIDTCEFNNAAKNQSESHYILALAKITNLPKFQNFEMYIVH